MMTADAKRSAVIGLSVFDRPRGPIRQFARAISASGDLSEDEVFEEILRAFLLGEFGDDEMDEAPNCAVCLPTTDGGIQERPDGTFRTTWKTADGALWTGSVIHDLPRPFRGFTRHNFREAVLAWSDAKTLADDDGNLPFELLANLTIADYASFFRGAYLDQLYIETAAVKEWRARTAPSAVTEEAAQTVTPADPWEALIDKLPERPLIKEELAGHPRVAPAAVAVIHLFNGAWPTGDAEKRLERANVFLREFQQLPVKRDSLRRAYNAIQTWRAKQIPSQG
jgi:hypothetical protein